MKLLTVDTIEQAKEKLLTHVKSWQLKTETLSLCETQGRILAEDIFSSCNIPPFHRSTVDGYAVAASDTAGAGETVPVYLKKTGSVIMGQQCAASLSIRCGECVYVPTGGMMPAGADAVVMIEYTEDAGGIIAVYEAVSPGTGTIEAGEDFLEGKLLLKKGSRIRPQEIGALCAAGITSITVYVPLAVSIISAGDELTVPENNPAPGEIRDINSNTLKALAEKYGYFVISTQMLNDDEMRLEAAVKNVMVSADIVIVSGGSSQGEKDNTALIMSRVSKPGVFTHGLAVKPGKPTILGWDEETKTLLAGLPGHPVSAVMIFELLFGAFFAEEVYQISNSSFSISHSLQAKISCNVPGSPGRAVCLPVALSLDNGTYTANPVFGKAGMISVLTRADGYLIIDMNKEGLKKDEIVLVHLFKGI